MKTKIWALAFLIAGIGIALGSAGTQAVAESGTVSCGGMCFSVVPGSGSVDVNSAGNNFLWVKGNVSIDTHGVGVCNKTKNGTICRGINSVEITGKNIRAFLKGNGTLSAEGTGKMIVGKGDLKTGTGVINYNKRGYAKIRGEGNVSINTSGNSTLWVRGKTTINSYGTGKCLENKKMSVTLCRGIEDADISGKNIGIIVKGKGTLSEKGKGRFNLWN